jgi:hypothetical protein
MPLCGPTVPLSLVTVWGMLKLSLFAQRTVVPVFTVSDEGLKERSRIETFASDETLLC